MPKKSTAVFPSNLGLFFDRPPLAVPARGLLAGLNFRIKEGKIEASNLGWGPFGTFNPLSGPVTLVEQFFLRSGGQILIFGTTKDLYQYVEVDGSVDFITPRYETGTANPTNGVATVSGSGTLWDTNLKIGDELFFGSTGEVDPDATGNGGWYEVLSITDDTNLTLTANYTGTGGAQAYTGRKLYTGDLLDYWRTATFLDAQPEDKDLWFATNGVDDIVTWDGVADQITPSVLTFTCKELAVFKNMLLYGSIIEDGGETKPTSIKNSDVGSPQELASGLAGEFVISDTVDPIVTMLQLGDNLIIYGTRTATIMQFVGDPLQFIFRTGLTGIGPLTGRLVADFGDFHKFIGADNQYTFDGVTLKEIGGHVWREILRTKAPNRIDLAFSHFDEENGDLIWAVPLTTDVNAGTDQSLKFAYPEHYLEGTDDELFLPFSKRDFPFTVGGFFERQTTLTWNVISDTWAELNFRWNDQFFDAAFPFSLLGDEAGQVFTLNTSMNGDGVALRSFVRFGRRAIGDGRERNLVRRIYPFADQFVAAGYTLDVTLYVGDHAQGSLTATPTLDYDITLGAENFVSPFRRGRYMEVEFGTAGPTQPWGLSGYDADVTSGGRR